MPNLVVPASGALIADARDGHLTINGVSLMTPAWRVLDLKPLWEPSTVRGTDRILPGVAGVKTNPKRATVTKKALAMVFVGYVDSGGGAQADPTTGLETNIFSFRSQIVDPSGTGDGTYNAVLTLHSGTVKSGPVHVVDLRFGNQVDAVALATLDLELPKGALA